MYSDSIRSFEWARVAMDALAQFSASALEFDFSRAADPRPFERRRRGKMQPDSYNCGIATLLEGEACVDDPVSFLSRRSCTASLRANFTPLELLRTRARFACLVLEPAAADDRLARARANAHGAAFEDDDIVAVWTA